MGGGGKGEPGGACGGSRRWTWGGSGVLGGAGGAGAWVAGALVGGLVWPEGGGGGGHGSADALVVAPGAAGAAGAGPGGSWWHLGEQERREWVVEARWQCGECGRRGRVCRAGGEQERRRLRDRASSLESGQSGAVGGSWGASRGAVWYWGGGGPPLSMDPPRRGVVAAAAGGMGRVTVLGGVGPGGALRRERGGRGDTVPGTGGAGWYGGGGPWW